MSKPVSKKIVALICAVAVIVVAAASVIVVAVVVPKEKDNNDKVFTFLWTSDPQWYSFKYPEIIEHQNQWIAENYKDYDIRYMFHTGDFVNLPHNHEEWAVMTASYEDLDDCGIPYGVLAGNHDVDKDDHTEFSQYFGAARYEDNKWYGGDYEDNFGHYDLMTIAGVDFIFAYMGYNEEYADEDIAWLNEVLAEHNDRIAILCFHDYLKVSGKRSANGDLFFEKVVLQNPNVRLVLCGHNYLATRRYDFIDDNGDGDPDRNVFQIMANYQATLNGGNGFMRFMECDVENGTIKSTTYSPYLDRYGSDFEDGTRFDMFGTIDEFTIPFDFSQPTPDEDTNTQGEALTNYTYGAR